MTQKKQTNVDIAKRREKIEEMLKWLPTKARKDEPKSSLLKKPDLSLREGMRSRVPSSPPLRYMVIRQSSPEACRKNSQQRKPHKKAAQRQPSRGQQRQRRSRQRCLDYVSHYDHDISTLHTAAEHGDLLAIERLYHKGVNLNARNENGETALFLAALYDQPSTVSGLHKMGASVHMPDKLGQTPLFIAATENLTDVIQLLVTLGAHVNTANRSPHHTIPHHVIPHHTTSQPLHHTPLLHLISSHLIVAGTGARPSTELP